MAKVKSSPRIEPTFESGASSRSAPSRTMAMFWAWRARRREKRRGTRAKRRQGGFILRTLRGTFYWGSVAALWGLVSAVGIMIWYGLQLPDASQWRIPERPPNVKIIAVDGQLVGNRGDTGGEVVAVEELPPQLINAVVAIEDRRFYNHFGLDPVGFSRAMWRNLRQAELREGGSTLTQQLAKNLFLSPERSFRRKVQELLLAFWLEAEYDKAEILEIYLNRVYFGAGAYGVDAASRRYFAKSARYLNLAESALLAGLLKAPSAYAPNRHPDRASTRTRLVLQAMVREGYITPEEAQAAIDNPARLAVRHLGRSESYVADMVMERLPHYIGGVESDIVVVTTLDMQLQRTAEWALVEKLREKGGDFGVEQGALVALDGTGAVRALVGGRDYSESQFNRAVTARRQPGSAFKPFVYLAALEAGLRPDSVRVDEPVAIGDWTPENYSKDYRGPVTLETALALSLNTVAAQLANEVGPDNVARVAHRLGINTSLSRTPSIALGTSEVSLLELTAAFVPFANGGHAVIPHVIQRIETLDGIILFERAGSGIGRAVRPEHVAMMNGMLQTTLEQGTGKRAVIDGWPAAGKTGTTQSYRDAWFIGYTANLSTGVWLGNDDGTATKRTAGGNLPAEIFADFMNVAHQGVPVIPLPGTRRFRPMLVRGLAPLDRRRPAPFEEGFTGNPATSALPPPGLPMPQRRRSIVDRLFGR